MPAKNYNVLNTIRLSCKRKLWDIFLRFSDNGENSQLIKEIYFTQPDYKFNN